MSEHRPDQEPVTAWWQASKTALATALLEREETIRRLQAEQYAILAEMDSRGVQAEYGYPTLVSLQVDLLRISRREAKARTRRTKTLCATRGVGTAVVPAAAPATAAAAMEGAVGPEHIDAVADMLGDLPVDLPVEEVEAYEKIVADLARETVPETVRKAAREIVARVDQDGQPPSNKEQQRPDRELRLGWRRDGQLGVTGHLDPETGRTLEAVFSPLTKPRPEPDGTPDPRTAAERNADALAEVLDLVQREDGLPDEAGVSATVTVVLDYNLLLAGLRTVGAIDDTTPITPEQARRLSCDCEIIPAVLGRNSELLDLGRTERFANRAQRRALRLRDKGCIFPNCDRPPRWTQAHHIKHWLDLGPTDLNNLCLLCTEHHRLIHHSEWEIRMAADGHPECIPPAFIDPQQQPRRNHAHHHP